MAAYVFDVRSGNGVRTRVALVGGQLIVGRGKESHIFLDSRTISRRHAEVVCDPFGRWWLRDLGSHNGTLVNGSRVTEHLLKHGDVVQVGEFSMALEAREESAEGVEAAGRSGVNVPVVEERGGGRVASMGDFESPRLAATHLSILSDFGQELQGLPGAGQRMAALCKLMVRPEFHGRSAVMLRASKETFTEAPQVLCDPQAAAGDEAFSPYISKTLLRTLLARNEAVLASNSSAAARKAGPAAADMAELSLAADVMTISAVACPVRSEEAHTDLLYVLFPPEYGNSEWLALTVLAVKQYQQAESAWVARKMGEDHASIERELSRAHAIQKRLVPKELAIPGLDFAIGFTPCRWVGGDYVDLVRGPDGKILLTIADVCGKGLPAALVASSLHMLTHTAMRTNTSLAVIMQNLNIYLTESLTEGTFVTMLAALLDPETGRLEVINAGHPAGLFVTVGGGVELTQAGENLPLGLDATAELVAQTTTLERGTYLVMFTDGLTELNVADERMMGEEGLANHIADLVKGYHEGEVSDASAHELARRLSGLLDSVQVGMAQDDRTFLWARRL